MRTVLYQDCPAGSVDILASDGEIAAAAEAQHRPRGHIKPRESGIARNISRSGRHGKGSGESAAAGDGHALTTLPMEHNTAIGRLSVQEKTRPRIKISSA